MSAVRLALGPRWLPAERIHRHRSRFWSQYPRFLTLQMYRGTGLS